MQMTRENLTQDDWVTQAALCELFALSLQLPTRELVEALVSGEFADALREIGEKTGLDPSALSRAFSLLSGYVGQDADALFPVLRTEYTRLFVGAPKPVVSPYAGVWYARKQGVEPLLFVSTRAMECERFMRAYGVGQAEGKNEPLDHIATEFEFLQYLALINVGVAEAPRDIVVPEDVFSKFLSTYVSDWVGEFADTVAASSSLDFYKAMTKVLREVGAGSREF
jgi:TorA maturation chaperone TorD